MSAPQSRVTYEVYPEWGGADPVWAGGIGLSLDELDVSASLAGRLRAWARHWEASGGGWGDHEYDAWNDAGLSLAQELQEELGSGVRVVYRK